MFPIRHSSIFRSRWMALLWAGGILWLAYDIAGTGEPAPGNNQQATMTDVTGATVDDAQVKQVESILANM
jgi:hypothetical protein